MQPNVKFYQRWAKIYCNMYLDKEKGPSHAREWALNMKFDKTQLKELGTHIRIEFKRRGLVSK